MSRLAAWLALAVSAPLFAGELVRNWGNWAYWATWGADLLVAVLLAAAGYASLRGAAPKYLASAWSFAAALYLSSFVGHAYRYLSLDGDLAAAEQRLMLIVGALLLVCLAGASMALVGRRSTAAA
jgi:hypothetical protein